MPIAITPPLLQLGSEDFTQCKLAAALKSLTANAATTDLVPEETPIVCFSDFDGTMFIQDTGHILFDTHGCGRERRKELSGSIRSGRRPFRETSDEMWGTLDVPFEKGCDLVKSGLIVDPGFEDYYRFCMDSGIPFHVMSSGMEPILRSVLELYFGREGAKNIPIIANGLDVSPDGSQWTPIWRHDSHLGHDKALSILEYRAKTATQDKNAPTPLVVFIGDGVSDLAAAREADILFARKGLQLERYCIEHKIAYYPFNTFADIQQEVKAIVNEVRRSDQFMFRPLPVARAVVTA